MITDQADYILFYAMYSICISGCLAPFEALGGLCFKFCFKCILHWTNVVSSKNSRPAASVKCPLCKTDNFSIGHDCDGSSFQKYYINQDSRNSVFFSKVHKYRLQCYYIKSGILIGVFNVSRYWKSRKYLQPNRWLLSWLKREIQALIQEEDVDIIAHHIHGVIDSMRRNEQKYQAKSPKTMTKQEEFEGLVTEAARPFLGGRTDQFVEEVELFMASGLTIEAYDKVYLHHLGWKIPEELPGDEADEEEKQEFNNEHTPLVPYMYIFDEDCDETD
ncbi:hypothetical protein LguiA_026165 [Lonicera macranthoides]